MTTKVEFLQVLPYPHADLRKVSRKVTDKDFNVKQLIGLMEEAMHRERGLGLSAIQVGAPLRIFITDGPAVSGVEGSDPLVFINPEIVDLSTKTVVDMEGCLSFPGATLPIARSESVRIRAWGRNGRMYELAASGLGARIIQHEHDHLDGRLLIDQVSHLRRDIFLKKYATWRKRARA